MRRQEAEEALLKRLESAFDRLAIQNDASRTENGRPSRNEIAEATKAESRIPTANSSAKLKSSRAPSSTDEPTLHPRDLLRSRLDQLHQEKQNRDLGVIDHYAQELTKLSTSLAPSLDPATLEPSASSFDSTQIDQRVRSLTKDLEWAVFEARQKAATANASLKAAQRTLDSRGDLTIQAHVHSLGLVRDELTKWIEERLLVCGDEEPAEDETGAVVNDDGTASHNDMQNSFHAFATARTDLLRIIHSTAKPPAAEPPNDQVGEGAQMALPQIHDHVLHLEQRSVASASQSGYDHAQLYFESQIQHEQEVTVEILQRLADESQLLPAYPMLNKSEKFSNARRVFGDNQEERPEQVTERTQAWSFAADAASETTKNQISQHLLEGHSAIKKADQNMQDFSFLKDMSPER
jgi:hypothetical protein